MNTRAMANGRRGFVLVGSLVCACLLMLSFPPPVRADSGFIPLASININEPGQKAIIGWDGQTELLILSTDVSADSNTTALQILPLPAQPDSIEEGSFDSFLRIGELIRDRYGHRGSWFDCGGREAGIDSGVDIVFHEKIGAHDISVAKATNAAGFVQWAEDFLARNEIQYQISSPELESVVTKYIEAGIAFFVFDLVELTTEQESIQPIVYRFQSDALYFPLHISSIVPGYTEITLFLFTPWRVVDSGELPKAERASNSGTPRECGLMLGKHAGKPIQFQLAEDELDSIDGRLAELLSGDAWLTTVVSYDVSPSWADGREAYPIPTATLQEDMRLTTGSFIAEPEAGTPAWAWVLVGIFLGILASAVVALICTARPRRRRAGG
ncbi:MAG: DUF2330 domain-containing protein [Chloroflexi bacterium]|nr:DUF2330 domain-containing protein [Chloroflexota bacterium]